MITFKAKTATSEIINSALSPFTFPAGEVHIKREERRDLEPVEIAIVQLETNSLHSDIFQIAMWKDYIDRTAKDTKTVLILPYVPGARADRGEPFGLEVYAHFLNGLKISQTIIFDPHSQVTPQLLAADLTVLYPEDFFAQSFIKSKFSHYTGIIAPDKGAVLRAKGVADVLDIPVYTAEKTRDFNTGKLTGFRLDGLPADGTYLIVDDICDGGGTFNGLAQAIGIPKERLDLYVSHGVFSSDATEYLPRNFGNIYFTNSFNPKKKLNWSYVSKESAFSRFDVIRLLQDQIKY